MNAYDVVVIGAGAAGLMCAAQAGYRGRRVLVVDHASVLGERIRISGGGRCNFTNRQVDAGQFLSANPHFCRSALSRYTPADFIALLDRHRIGWHEKTLGQLFCDDTAMAIVEMLKDECAQAGVRLLHPCVVQQVDGVDDPVYRYQLATDVGSIYTNALVVACGGLAVPKLGASALGYQIAAQFGIPVVQPLPALVPLSLPPDEKQAMASLAGVSFGVCAQGANDAPVFREHALITHRGLSGPAILQASSYWQQQRYHAGVLEPLRLNVLDVPDPEDWLAHIPATTALPKVLSILFPTRLARQWCDWRGINQTVGSLSRLQRKHLLAWLTDWRIQPSGTLGFAKAEVTLGGVDTRALSSKTLEARARPGLFFVGEVVDVTGWLGGYNFQWAWSSGWAAGQFA